MIQTYPRHNPDRRSWPGFAYFGFTPPARRAAFGLLLLLLGADGPIEAQVVHPPGPDTIRTVLQPLEARVAHPTVLGSASALVLDLDSADAPPAVSLADMMRGMPLLRIRDNSRGETHLTLRGAESRQVSVTLDGVPLTIGWDNRTDLSVIPLTGATRIIAVRGLSSLLAGPNVLGGVVHVGITPSHVPVDSPKPVRARGGVASGGSFAADLSLQHSFGSGSGSGLVRAGGGYRMSDYQPIPRSISQPAPAVPGERVNTDLNQWNAFLAGRIEGGSGRWLGISSMAFGAQRGVAPELHVAAPRLWRLPLSRRWVTVVGVGTGWQPKDLGPGSLSIRGAIDVGRFEIEEYASSEYQVVTGSETGDDRTLTLKLDGTQSLPLGKLALSLTGAETRHDERLASGAGARYRQRLFSVASEFGIPLSAPTGVGLLLGASLDGSDTPETGEVPARADIWDWGAKVASTVELPSLGGQAHAGISRRTRAPSLRELYSGALGRFVVNPLLGPETLVAVEVGLTAGGTVSQWQLVGFHHRATDGIVRESTGDGRFRRANRDKVLATGVELVGGARWRGLLLDGDLTLQHVGIEDPAAPEAQRHPEYQPSTAGNLELGVRLPAALLARLRVTYVGPQYCVHPDLGHDVRLGSATWGGVELDRSWKLGRGPTAMTLRVVGGVHNLTDASAYEQCGLPSRGRQFTLTLGLG